METPFAGRARQSERRHQRQIHNPCVISSEELLQPRSTVVMASRLALARQSLRQRGVQGLVADVRNFLAFNVLRASTDFTQHRYRLSNQVSELCDYTVRYGPFAGMQIARES